MIPKENFSPERDLRFYKSIFIKKKHPPTGRCFFYYIIRFRINIRGSEPEHQVEDQVEPEELADIHHDPY